MTYCGWINSLTILYSLYIILWTIMSWFLELKWYMMWNNDKNDPHYMGSRWKRTIVRDGSRRSFEPKRTIFWLKADDLMKADDPILAEKWIDLCNDSVIEVLDSKSEVSFGYDKG